MNPKNTTRRHGTRSRYVLGCRCPLCTNANRLYCASQQTVRAGQLEDGDRRHGTTNGYQNYGCRCPECRAANTEHARRHRTRRAAV